MAGGSTQQSLRRALGALKDTTRVSLAKVNSEYKDLDIAVVKATNHVESPPKNKHVRSIFAATSAARPRADVAYCIQLLARRLAKTHNWTVAVKTLIVIHRILREGDPTFREELSIYTSSRSQILNISNFKDDSSPNAWDYSAWVRTYALFLEERLECFRSLKYDVETERIQGHSRTRDFDTEDLLLQLPALQQLLFRLVCCQPEGAALHNYVIQYALALVIKESFKIYCAINDGIINLVDKFFEMQRHDAMKALDIYKKAGNQAERLTDFYEVCKGLELARTFQFPTLAQPPHSFLSTMEDYVRDAPRGLPLPRDILDNEETPVAGRLLITYRNEDEVDKEASPSATPQETIAPAVAPSLVTSAESPRAPVSQTTDLLHLSDFHPNAMSLEESNALALAIVPSGQTSNDGETSYGANNALDFAPGATGWELALVTTPSNNESALNNSKLAGGLDKLTLDGLYENALVKSSYASGYAGANNPFDTGIVQQDPFLASGKFPPPANVQMAAMAQHQQAMMMQQQQMMNNPPVNPFNNNLYAWSNPYGTDRVPNHYQNNPFGNPGLL